LGFRSRLSALSFCRASFPLVDIFEPHSHAASQAVASLFDSLQKPRVILKLKIEPIIVGRKADEDTGGLSVPRDRGKKYPDRGYAAQPRVARPRRATLGYEAMQRATLTGLCRLAPWVAMLRNSFRVQVVARLRYPGLPDFVGQPWAALPNAFSVESARHR